MIYRMQLKNPSRMENNNYYCRIQAHISSYQNHFSLLVEDSLDSDCQQRWDKEQFRELKDGQVHLGTQLDQVCLVDMVVLIEQLK